MNKAVFVDKVNNTCINLENFVMICLQGSLIVGQTQTGKRITIYTADTKSEANFVYIQMTNCILESMSYVYTGQEYKDYLQRNYGKVNKLYLVH